MHLVHAQAQPSSVTTTALPTPPVPSPASAAASASASVSDTAVPVNLQGGVTVGKEKTESPSLPPSSSAPSAFAAAVTSASNDMNDMDIRIARTAAAVTAAHNGAALSTTPAAGGGGAAAAFSSTLPASQLATASASDLSTVTVVARENIHLKNELKRVHKAIKAREKAQKRQDLKVNQEILNLEDEYVINLRLRQVKDKDKRNS